ncbi:MAG: hypothetical protein JW395_1461 [Nitrospira sp.]|nr:hypothetical protein [Nitrospira sp.]
MAWLLGKGQAEGPGLHTLPHQGAHLFDLLGAGLAALALVAHDIVAHRAVANQHAYIHSEALVDGVHVFAHGLPSHIHRLKGLHGNGFDVGEELLDALFAALAHRSQAERAVADDYGSRAVVAGEAAQRIPGHLGIVVAVRIDKSGSHHQTVRIDGALGRAAQLADLGDLAVANADVGAEGWRARSINHPTVLNQEIKAHLRLLLWRQCNSLELPQWERPPFYLFFLVPPSKHSLCHSV